MDLSHAAGSALLRPKAGVRHYLLALAFAVVGGLLGILGAFAAEARSGVPFLIAFIGAPVVEEITKPAGIYLFLIRWRGVIQNQLVIALLVAISGICFGLLESLVYVTLYVPDHSRTFFIYRFTVTIALHGIASFIAGLGVNERLVDWANGAGPLPRHARYSFGAAIALHAIYNTAATVLYVTGHLDLD